MLPAASVDTVLDFCNKVREAGGAKPLDALLPGIPQDADSCLIAKNLNFQCEVRPIDGRDLTNKSWERFEKEISKRGTRGWGMVLRNKAARDRIARSLNLIAINFEGQRSYGVLLPPKIANVAKNFDAIGENFMGEYEDRFVDLVDDGMSEDEAKKVAFQQANKGLTRAMRRYAALVVKDAP